MTHIKYFPTLLTLRNGSSGMIAADNEWKLYSQTAELCVFSALWQIAGISSLLVEFKCQVVSVSPSLHSTEHVTYTKNHFSVMKFLNSALDDVSSLPHILRAVLVDSSNCTNYNLFYKAGPLYFKILYDCFYMSEYFFCMRGNLISYFNDRTLIKYCWTQNIQENMRSQGGRNRVTLEKMYN